MAVCLSHVMLRLGFKNVNKFASLTNKHAVIVQACAIKPQVYIRPFSKEAEEEEVQVQDEVEYEAEAVNREAEIEKKRDKSGLKEYHKNVLRGDVPYSEPVAWFHHSVKYKQRMIGRYGLSATDDPLGIMWPTKDELESMKEFERAYRPDSLQTMMARVSEKARAEEEAIRKRQEDIVAKYAKLGQWRKEMDARIAKAAELLEAQRLKKTRLVEEVRRHFGYTVDPKDEKFKAMLEQKEKEQAKAEKAAKKAAKQEKILKRLQTGSAEASKLAASQGGPVEQPSASAPPPQPEESKTDSKTMQG